MTRVRLIDGWNILTNEDFENLKARIMNCTAGDEAFIMIQDFEGNSFWTNIGNIDFITETPEIFDKEEDHNNE